MRLQILFITLLFTITAVNTSFAQFDFGNIIEGRARQAFQKFERRLPAIENQIRREIRQKLPKILPPVHSNPVMPYPIKPAPIHPPGRVITHPTYPAPVAKNPAPQPKPQPTKKKPAKPKLPEVEAGSVVTFDGESFGETAGQVYVKIDALILKAKTLAWSNTSVEFQLPALPIVEANEASVIVMNANEDIVEHMEVSLIPSTSEEAKSPAADPGSESVETPSVVAGQQLTIEGDLGAARGTVELRIGKMKLSARIVEWKKTGVTFDLPKMGLVEAQPAKLVVLTAKGKIVDSIKVNFSPDEE